MINKTTLLFLTLVLFLMIGTPALAQSYLPGVSDGQHSQNKDSNSKSKSNAEMQNNPATPNLNNPAMVKPSDPTGVNSNTPGSSGTPPPSSNAPEINSGGQSPSAPPSGH